MFVEEKRALARAAALPLLAVRANKEA